MNVGAYPGIDPRLVVDDDAREDLSAYRARGGYGAGLEGMDLVEATDLADLRGRGGAAFPMGVKLRSVVDRPAPRFAVANGEEGEPASLKDRWLMRRRPHLVLDGLLRCTRVAEFDEAFVYVSDRASEESMAAAVEELGQRDIVVRVVRVDPTYVAGEASSVVRALNGGPGKPTDKPPFPFDEGVRGSTTLISNVETLANMPFIAMQGGTAYRELGEGRALGTGTLLMTVSGHVERPGLYEVPLGLELGPALDEVAALRSGATGFVLGGFFTGITNLRAAQFSISYEEMRLEGSGLGCGAVIVLGPQDCPVFVAADVTAYLARENAGQCGACINGTPAMARVLADLSHGVASDDDLGKLDRWSHTLRGRGACGLLDAVCNMASSLRRDFAEVVDGHRGRSCEMCEHAHAESQPGTSRFALSPDALTSPDSFTATGTVPVPDTTRSTVGSRS